MVWSPPAPLPTTSRPLVVPASGEITARTSTAMARKMGSQSCEDTEWNGRQAVDSLSYPKPIGHSFTAPTVATVGEPGAPRAAGQGTAGRADPGGLRRLPRSADRPWP